MNNIFKKNNLFLILLALVSSALAVLINPIYILAGLALFFSILFFYFYPNWGIYLMVLFFPFVGLQFFFGQDYNLPLIDIITSLVFITWILRYFFEKKNFKKSLIIFPAWLIFALFIAVNLISLFNSYDLFLSLKYIFRPLAFFYFAFLVLPSNIINSYKILKNAFWIFLSLGIFAAAMGMFSLFLDFGEFIPRARPIAIAGWAPLGFNHNALAELLITIIPLNWLLIILSKKEIVKKFLSIAFILMISILLLTFSRTGWICLFLEILFFWYFIYREQTKKLFKKIPSLAFLILPIAFIFFLLMFQLLTSSVGWQANENRLFLNEISYEAFLNHPIIGNGAGTFISLVRANPAYILEYGQPLDSHGVIQKIAVESGILGLIAFLVFIFYILRKLFVGFKNSCSKSKNTDLRFQLPKLKNNKFKNLSIGQTGNFGITKEGEAAPPRLQSGYPEYSQEIFFAFFLVALASFVFQLFSTSYFIANFWLPIGIGLAAVKIIEKYPPKAQNIKNKNKLCYLIKNMDSKKKEKIKLTHIICSLGYGGAERFLIDLIKNTDREKYEISVLCVVEGGPLVKELELIGIHPFIIGKKTKLGILTIWKIYKYLKKEKIKIVHTHLFAGDTWGRIAAVSARTPIIISTEHSVNFNEGIIKRLLKKILSFYTNKIIAISQTVKENSQKRDWINPKKIEVIYNGIDLVRNNLYSAEKKIQSHDINSLQKNILYPPEISNGVNLEKFFSNNITLGFVGRLEKEKGAECLIKAMGLIEKNKKCHPKFISGSTNIFTDKNPSEDKEKINRFRNKFGMTNLKLKILGDGTQRKNLEAMSSQLGLENKIEFLGFKNNPAKFYQEITILIVPSLWEGLNIAALEAMASDVPIIASNVGGLKEIIEDGKTGILFESGDSKDLAEKIIWAAENPDKMNLMAEKAKNKVEDFDIQKKAREYKRIYENFTN